MALPPILEALTLYVVLVFVITVHEWAHAWVADMCGDSTARLLGRMTLNPLPHLDMLGTVVIPLFGLLGPVLGLGTGIALIGWGRPVPVNPMNFRKLNRDDVLVSFAGPLSNIVMTVIALIAIRLLLPLEHDMAQLAIQALLLPMAHIAFFLAFFNLIPIPPLDGSHLLRALLSFNARQAFDKLSSYGFIIILILINTPVFGVVFGGVDKLYGMLAYFILKS
jgi:Zn-dependent protease